MNGTSGTLSFKPGPRNNNAQLSLNMRHKKWIFNLDAGDYFYRSNNSSDYTWKDTNQYLLKQSFQNLYILFGLSWKLGKKEVQVPVTRQAATESPAQPTIE